MHRIRLILLAAIVGTAMTGLAISQAPERREPAPPGDSPGAGPQFRVLPPFAQRELQLTPEQQKQVEALEADIQAKMQKILTPEQLKQWSERRGPRGSRPDQPGAGPNPPRREPGDDNRPPRTRDADAGEPAGSGRDAGGDNPRRGGPGRRGGDAGREERPRDAQSRDGQPRDGQSSTSRRPRWPMERVVQQLQLTTEQQAKVDKVLEAHHEKTRALFRQAQADLLAQMKAVLTDEQFKQFTKALEEGPPGFRRPDRSDGPDRRNSVDRPGGPNRKESAADEPRADAKK